MEEENNFKILPTNLDLGVFGVALLAPALPVGTKEAPKNEGPKPTELCLASATQPAVIPS